MKNIRMLKYTQQHVEKIKMKTLYEEENPLQPIFTYYAENFKVLADWMNQNFGKRYDKITLQGGDVRLREIEGTKYTPEQFKKVSNLDLKGVNFINVIDVNNG
jgi:hypothetical protein